MLLAVQVKELETAQSTYDNAKTVLEEKQALLETAQKDLAAKEAELSKADAAAVIAKQNAEDAKKEADKQSGILGAIEKAKAAFETATNKLSDLIASLENLNTSKEEIADKLDKATKALDAAIEQNKRAQALNYDELMTTPTTDSDYTYINDYIEKVKELKDKVAAERAERERIERENAAKKNTSSSTATTTTSEASSAVTFESMINDALSAIGNKFGLNLVADQEISISGDTDDDAEDAILRASTNAAPGSKVTINMGTKGKISKTDMLSIMARGDVTFVFKINYMGNTYTIQIPATDEVLNMLDENGELDLLSFFTAEHNHSVIKIDENIYDPNAITIEA